MTSTSVEERLAYLEQIREIEYFLYDYQHACDTWDWDTWENAFADDAEMIIDGGKHGHNRGRETIIAISKESMKPYKVSQHHFNNVRITPLGPNEAQMRADLLLIFMADPAKTEDFYMAGGKYDWRLRKEDGRWKFVRYQIDFAWNHGALSPEVFEHVEATLSA